MLSTSKLVGFVATARPVESKHFYQSVLGLNLREESQYALVFAAHGTTIRVQKVQSVTPSGYTTLGWEVSDLAAVVEQLSKQGVSFERYDGLPQNEAGIWTTPNGSKVAWLRDPDGNTLSLTEHAGAKATDR